MTQADKKQLGRIALQQRAVPQGGSEAGVPLVERLKSLSEQSGVPAIDLRQVCIHTSDLDFVPVEIARQHVILPVLLKGDRLFVAMASPSDQKVIDELEFVTDKKVFPYVALRDALVEVIDSAYAARGAGEEYFTGPDCPPEMLARARASRVPAAPGAPPSIPAPRAHSAPPPAGLTSKVDPSPMPPAPAPVVVADAMDRAARRSDFPDDDFGDIAKELSAVTDLPVRDFPAGQPGERTVLVVDDEDEIRAMIERILRAKGYRVLSTGSGREALAMVKEHTPDVMVLDAMLPEIHGFDLARRLKQSERYAHLPIVMVSAVYRGWRFAEDLRESCGVEHYIEKPFKIADVVSAVERALADRAPEPPSSRDREMSAEAEGELAAGITAYQEGRVDDAVTHLRRGLAIDPLAFRLRFHLGLLYGKKEQVYDAISELERAVEINPRHFPAVRNLAILYQKAGFRNKATEMWERALKSAPDDVTRQSIKQHLVSIL